MRRLTMFCCLFLALLLVVPTVTYADEPRHAQLQPPLPQMTPTPVPYQRTPGPLPPLQRNPQAQQRNAPADLVEDMGGFVSDAWVWFSTSVNPGKWVLDAMLGGATALIKAVTGMIQGSVGITINTLSGGQALGSLRSASTGTLVQQDMGDGCAMSAFSAVFFCTPLAWTGGNPDLLVFWHYLRPYAAGLLLLFFNIRLGRLIAGGPQMLALEGRQLFFHVILAIAFVMAPGPIMVTLIQGLNLLHAELLAHAPGDVFVTITALVVQSDQGLTFGAAIANLCFWIAIAVLLFRVIARIFKLQLLMAIAPIYGALALEKSTYPRFVVWFARLIDLLIEQTGWLLLAVLASLFLNKFGMQNAFVANGLVAIYGMIFLCMVLFGHHLLRVGVAPGSGHRGLVTALAVGRLARFATGGGSSGTGSGSGQSSESGPRRPPRLPDPDGGSGGSTGGLTPPTSRFPSPSRPTVQGRPSHPLDAPRPAAVPHGVQAAVSQRGEPARAWDDAWGPGGDGAAASGEAASIPPSGHLPMPPTGAPVAETLAPPRPRSSEPPGSPRVAEAGDLTPGRFVYLRKTLQGEPGPEAAFASRLGRVLPRDQARDQALTSQGLPAHDVRQALNKVPVQVMRREYTQGDGVELRPETHYIEPRHLMVDTPEHWTTLDNEWRSQAGPILPQAPTPQPITAGGLNE